MDICCNDYCHCNHGSTPSRCHLPIPNTHRVLGNAHRYLPTTLTQHFNLSHVTHYNHRRITVLINLPLLMCNCLNKWLHNAIFNCKDLQHTLSMWEVGCLVSSELQWGGGYLFGLIHIWLFFKAVFWLSGL